MLIRSEKKYLVSRKDTINFLNNFNFYSKHPDRKINSIYLDTSNFDDFIDGEEGTVPRKKVRIRWYGDQKINKDLNQDYQLEIKKTKASERSKEVIKYFGKIENILTVAKKYYKQPRKPLLVVSYSRQYYEDSKNNRITVDSDLSYIKVDDNLNFINKHYSNDNIIELKNDLLNFSDIEYGYLENFRVRYSKYCDAVNKLFYL